MPSNPIFSHYGGVNLIMELFETENSIEETITRLADARRTPIGGGVELLPLCNMNCRMCYVHHLPTALSRPILTGEEWTAILQKAKYAGVLFLLLTGGEPLLHPDFKKIYLTALRMGFVVTVNTNGTLIDETLADFFAGHPCRRLNVTLYGASAETYARLSGYPEGYEKARKALGLLKERNVPCRINITITRENRADQEAIVRIARGLDIPFVIANYMLPPARAPENTAFRQSRMNPADAAASRLEANFLMSPGEQPVAQARLLLHRLREPRANILPKSGFACRAARSGFWIDWEGNLTPCGMIDKPGGSLLQRDFMDVWKDVIAAVERTHPCEECVQCTKRFFCQTCAAACLCESGSFSARPQYLCDVTDEMVKQLIALLPEEEQQEYQDLIPAGKEIKS